jgi:hypothetical protein
MWVNFEIATFPHQSSCRKHICEPQYDDSVALSR